MGHVVVLCVSWCGLFFYILSSFSVVDLFCSRFALAVIVLVTRLSYSSICSFVLLYLSTATLYVLGVLLFRLSGVVVDFCTAFFVCI